MAAALGPWGEPPAPTAPSVQVAGRDRGHARPPETKRSAKSHALSPGGKLWPPGLGESGAGKGAWE